MFWSHSLSTRVEADRAKGPDSVAQAPYCWLMSSDQYEAVHAPISETEARDGAEVAGGIVANVERFIQGKREVIDLSLTCLLAEGHLLLEDVPGVGKTSLARSLAASLGMSWHRIQFTPTCCPVTSRECRYFTRAVHGLNFILARSSLTSFWPMRSTALHRALSRRCWR